MLRIPSVILLVFLVSLSAQAAVIVKVKGRKALVDLENMQVDVGDKLIAIDLYGKTRGIVKIHKIKRDKAIALLMKGRMQAEWILEAPSKKTMKAYSSSSKRKKRSTSLVRRKSSRLGAPTVGLLAGGNFNVISIPSSQDLLSGLSWTGAVFLDIFTFVKWIGIRAIAGYNKFLATGQSASQGLLIHYPGAKVLVKGVFWQKPRFHVWGGLGGALFYPFVDQQMDLNLDYRSFKGLHGAVSAALGADIQVGGVYIPIQVDINWINPVMWLPLNAVQQGSRQFKPFYISLHTGLGFHF